jgi:integrase
MQAPPQLGKVTLYVRQPQPNGKWKFFRVPENRLAKLTVLDENDGLYYLSWYEGRKKKFLNVGRMPDEARTAYANKLNGDPVTHRDLLTDGGRATVEDGLTKFFRELKNEAGKDGIGKSDRTLETYNQRLGLFQEFCDDRNIVYLDRVTRDHLVAYIEWLRAHEKDLSDRSVYNIFSVARSFLISTGVWKEALKKGTGANLGKPIKLGFTEKPVEAYTKEQLKSFFAVCDDEERLVFAFFLNSGCRKSEVAYTEVADLDFKRHLLHVQGKPHRRFRLKGKEDRFVPMPATLMKLLKKHCADKKPNDLVFPNAETGGVEAHFLRRLQIIAKRAKMPVEDWTLHAFRRTFATIHHEDNGVSVNTLKTWLGHKEIETTLRYLESANAASAAVRDTVNKGALAVFV